MNKLITVVKWVLVAIGFLTVYALVDIIYNVNLLAPLWWLLEADKQIVNGLGGGHFISFLVFILEYVLAINAYKCVKVYLKNSQLTDNISH